MVSINNFLGRKTSEVVAGEVVKKVVSAPKEKSILDEIKSIESTIKEACDVVGIDYKDYKKKLIGEVKTIAKTKISQFTPNQEPQKQQPVQRTLTNFQPVKEPVLEVTSEKTSNNKKMDFNKIFIGLDLFLEFSNKQEMKVKELKEFIEKNNDRLNEILEVRQVKGFKLFLKMAGDNKNMAELKQFLEENKEDIEEIFN